MVIYHILNNANSTTNPDQEHWVTVIWLVSFLKSAYQFENNGESISTIIILINADRKQTFDHLFYFKLIVGN